MSEIGIEYKRIMEEIEKIAKTISETLAAELGTKVFIAIGTARRTRNFPVNCFD